MKERPAGCHAGRSMPPTKRINRGMEEYKKYGIDHLLGFFSLTCEEDSKDPSLLRVSIHWPSDSGCPLVHGGITEHFDQMWLCSVRRGETDQNLAVAYSAAVRRLEEVHFWDCCSRWLDQPPLLEFFTEKVRYLVGVDVSPIQRLRAGMDILITGTNYKVTIRLSYGGNERVAEYDLSLEIGDSANHHQSTFNNHDMRYQPRTAEALSGELLGIISSSGIALEPPLVESVTRAATTFLGETAPK